MKKSYDFTGAVQGKFTIKEEDIILPHYLQPATELALRSFAEKAGKDADEVLEAILARELPRMAAE